MKVMSSRFEEKELKKKLKKKLDERRYEHSLGVAYTAAALMMSHCEEKDSEKLQEMLDKAYTAGLLHDCAKCLEPEETLRLCKKYKVELNQTEQDYPYLIHAKLGAVLAREKYGVEDEEILSAIRFHTTGKEDMSLLEAVIFSADFVEPNRKPLLCLPAIRNILYKDLNRGVLKILEQTIVHLEHRGQPVEEHTLSALNWYRAHYGEA